MIAATIARLEANKVAAGLKLVSGAASFQAAFENTPTAMPAIYVIPLEEQPGANEGGGGVIVQRVRVSLGICFALANVADAKGAAASNDLTARRDPVRGLLMGWPPVAGHDPFVSGRGHLLAFKPGGVLWWQDIYTSAFTRRVIPS